MVLKSVALPFAAVPAKSKAAAFSVCLGVPVAAGLSSQKRTWVTPVVGVVKTAMLPATVLRRRAPRATSESPMSSPTSEYGLPPPPLGVTVRVTVVVALVRPVAVLVRVPV